MRINKRCLKYMEIREIIRLHKLIVTETTAKPKEIAENLEFQNGVSTII